MNTCPASSRELGRRRGPCPVVLQRLDGSCLAGGLHTATSSIRSRDPFESLPFAPFALQICRLRAGQVDPVFVHHDDSSSPHLISRYSIALQYSHIVQPEGRAGIARQGCISPCLTGRKSIPISCSFSVGSLAPLLPPLPPLLVRSPYTFAITGRAYRWPAISLISLALRHFLDRRNSSRRRQRSTLGLVPRDFLLFWQTMLCSSSAYSALLTYLAAACPAAWAA